MEEDHDGKQEALAIRARLHSHEVLETDDHAAGLHALLNAELAQDKESVKMRRAAAAKCSSMPNRFPNRKWLISADHGMRSVRGHGLDVFLPRRRLGQLTHSHNLYIAVEACADGSESKNHAFM